MAFLLRSSVNICRASATYQISMLGKARPLSSLANFRIDDRPQNENRLCSTLKAKPLGLLSKVQSFSTSSAVLASGGVDHHDHSKIWTLERLLSIALMPVVPLGIMYPNILLDLIMSVAIVMHVHWGVEAVVVDYVRPIIFGKVIPKISLGLVYVFSVVLLLGLLNLSFRGQGIGNSINTIWSM
uniref:Succinate dehydrogenase [ubiquinone] cytochrome b small subunit n=1 Tax=Lygus hesperus TaxID=30085 RepID=A0A0A9WVI8_LYGHE